MAKKIKVAGYTKKIIYNDNISYRPFNPITKEVDDAIFTNGDFSIVSNFDVVESKPVSNGIFSEYYDLNRVGLTKDELIEIYGRKQMTLNLNKNSIKNYAYFGSFRERLRAELENIIKNFPAGVVIYPYNTTNPGVFSPTYVPQNIHDGNYCCFNVQNTNNPYNIRLLKQEPISETNHKLRDILLNKYSYSLTDGSIKLDVEVLYDDMLDLGVGQFYLKGVGSEIQDTFPNNEVLYLIPNDREIEKFYFNLTDLGRNLLNRNIYPKYTYELTVRRFSEEMGVFVEYLKRDTWPTSDGWNLDFDNNLYSEYITNLINISDEFDSEFSNIIVRQLVSSSILEFDTVPSIDVDNIVDEGQKIKSLLSVYGRSYDELKNYIDGLKFIRTITYDKVDNAPDEIVKDLAHVLGWDLWGGNLDLTSNFFLRKSEGVQTYTGHYLTREELEVETFRRLILNTPWIWKSKGTRKSIDFMNKFLGIPSGLININEYVYVAPNPVDVNWVSDLIIKSNPSAFEDVNYYIPFDDDGYPILPPNTNDYYYQGNGGWYQETGGINSILDLNTGNNPHFGEYDNGKKYFDIFNELVPDFSPFNEVVTDLIPNRDVIIYENFNSDIEGQDISFDLIVAPPSYEMYVEVQDKFPYKAIQNDCGCDVEGESMALTIGVEDEKIEFRCDYEYAVWSDKDNIIHFYLANGDEINVDEECCSSVGGEYTYSYSKGSYVCAWKAIIECERYVSLGYTQDGLEYFDDQQSQIYTTIVPLSSCCSKDSIPIAVSGGYNCSFREAVMSKCYTLNSYEIPNDLPNDLSFTYNNSKTKHKKTDVFSGDDVLVGEFLINKSIDVESNLELSVGSDKIILTKDELFNHTTVEDIELGKYTKTIKVGSNNIKLNYSPSDCVEVDYNRTCINIVEVEYFPVVASMENKLSVTYNTINTLSLLSKSTDEGEFSTKLDLSDDSVVVNLSSKFNITYEDDTNLSLSGTELISLKDHIFPSEYDPSDTSIKSFNTTILGVPAVVRYKYDECNECSSFFEFGEYEYLGKKYLLFSDLDENELETVPTLDCCPSYTTPVESDGEYRCATKDLECTQTIEYSAYINDDCVLTTGGSVIIVTKSIMIIDNDGDLTTIDFENELGFNSEEIEINADTIITISGVYKRNTTIGTLSGSTWTITGSELFEYPYKRSLVWTFKKSTTRLIVCEAFFNLCDNETLFPMPINDITEERCDFSTIFKVISTAPSQEVFMDITIDGYHKNTIIELPGITNLVRSEIVSELVSSPIYIEPRADLCDYDSKVDNRNIAFKTILNEGINSFAISGDVDSFRCEHAIYERVSCGDEGTFGYEYNYLNITIDAYRVNDEALDGELIYTTMKTIRYKLPLMDE